MEKNTKNSLNREKNHTNYVEKRSLHNQNAKNVLMQITEPNNNNNASSSNNNNQNR